VLNLTPNFFEEFFMKEKILAWIIEWLLKNIDKELIDKLMKNYVLPFVKKEKALFYKWVDEVTLPHDGGIDDAVAQILKMILDVLVPE
jgi:hypothetical protein